MSVAEAIENCADALKGMGNRGLRRQLRLAAQSARVLEEENALLRGQMHEQQEAMKKMAAEHAARRLPTTPTVRRIIYK